MPVDPDRLRDLLTEYTCGQKCMGAPGNKGGCCTLADRDFILGPVSDSAAFLDRLSTLLGRPVLHHEVFIDHDEGRARFPLRSTWQSDENYPALRVVPNDPRHPCAFYDADRGCTVYAIRPEMCRNYACEPLRRALTVV